ncbi:MAG: DUF4397 domain-containing protein [Chitinophagaceae bacterium]|jgi:hypothetical protein|nr:DUF4397 domain-containing protein [Chitinophagaceae bacterium]
MIKSKQFIVLYIIIVSCYACTKESSLNTRAQIKFINASINSPKLELFADGALLATDIAYPNASNYVFVSPGNASLRIAALDGPFPGLTIANGTFSVAEYEIYSLIVTDSLSKLKVSFMKDEISTAGEGKAKIRFFHLAQNTSVANLFLNITKIDSNRVFNDQNSNANAQKFSAVNAGTVNLEVKDTLGNIITTLPNTVLGSNKIYTIILKGSPTALANTPQAMGLTILPYN